MGQYNRRRYDFRRHRRGNGGRLANGICRRNRTKHSKDLDITPVRGLEGIKEAAVEVGELGTVRVAVAHGLGNARRLMDRVAAGTADYHFIEIMACPGGCVGGGGQPLPVSDEKRALRAKALYQ